MTKNTSSFPPFHEKFLSRVVGLDIMDASSVVVAAHLAADGHTKVPVDKIKEISEKMLDQMIGVQASDSQFVGQVLPLLEQGYAGLKAQIAAYRQNGDMSDDRPEQDDASIMLIRADGGQSNFDKDNPDLPGAIVAGAGSADINGAVHHRTAK